MIYLLDTNAVIALLNRTNAALRQKIRQYPPGDVYVSSIVMHELFYGAFKSARVERNVALVDGLQFSVLEFDTEDARAAGKIRADLAHKGVPIGAYDVLIAGQALARGGTLVTHNTREFERVAGLSVEDWER